MGGFALEPGILGIPCVFGGHLPSRTTLRGDIVSSFVHWRCVVNGDSFSAILEDSIVVATRR